MPISHADLLYRSLDRMAGRHAALLTNAGATATAAEATADRADAPDAAHAAPARPAVGAARPRRWWRRLAA